MNCETCIFCDRPSYKAPCSACGMIHEGHINAYAAAPEQAEPGRIHFAKDDPGLIQKLAKQAMELGFEICVELRDDPGAFGQADLTLRAYPPAAASAADNAREAAT